MKNERGITLVELLAVLALVGTIITIIIIVFINGMKATERNAINQRLQQEANVIVETIRNEYLKLDDTGFVIQIDKEKQNLLMDGKLISTGYDYQFPVDAHGKRVLAVEINRDATVYFELTIGKGKLDYKVETKFSKLQ